MCVCVCMYIYIYIYIYIHTETYTYLDMYHARVTRSFQQPTLLLLPSCRPSPTGRRRVNMVRVNMVLA